MNKIGYPDKPSNFRQPTVLLVDDNDEHGEIIHKTMRDCLPEVTLIRQTTPQDAIDWLQQNLRDNYVVPNLILLDLYLPAREDGFALFKQIKALGKPFAQVPVVMLSYSDSVADISQAYKQGVSSYLTKPLDWAGWLFLFQQLRMYWWETVTLPSSAPSY